jgi:3-oxoacyl-[acyl-carrier-protein] synthase II
MILAGIGIVFTRGRGVDAFETALREGWQPPEWRPVESSPGVEVPVYSVPDDMLRDRSILGKMRRTDRFSKMSVLAASDALMDSGIEISAGSHELGILLASGLGSHATAFRFLDEMITYGEAAPSPTLFSQSVQNAAASHVALHLQTHGPTMTLTQFHLSFHQAIVLASAWMQEGRCSRVLVGATEECGSVMEYVCSTRIRLARSGRIEPLRCGATPEAVPGEGSIFFLLTRDEPPRRYCELRAIDFPAAQGALAPSADLVLLDADGFTSDETSYLHAAGASPVAAYSPVFGSMMTGTAFHCAAAALMLRAQARIACPVTQNPHGLTFPVSSEPARLEEIQCLRFDCDGRRGVVRVRR